MAKKTKSDAAPAPLEPKTVVSVKVGKSDVGISIYDGLQDVARMAALKMLVDEANKNAPPMIVKSGENKGQEKVDGKGNSVFLTDNIFLFEECNDENEVQDIKGVVCRGSSLANKAYLASFNTHPKSSKTAKVKMTPGDYIAALSPAELDEMKSFMEQMANYQG